MDEICWDPITPEFFLKLLSSCKVDPQAAHFSQALADQVIQFPLALIKRFVGDDSEVGGGTFGCPIQQPTYVFDLRSILLEHMLVSVCVGIVSIPRSHRVMGQLLSLEAAEWWIADAPSLPLRPDVMQMRSLAWLLFRHAGYDDEEEMTLRSQFRFGELGA